MTFDNFYLFCINFDANFFYIINTLVYFLITLTVRIKTLPPKGLTTLNLDFNFGSKNHILKTGKSHLDIEKLQKASDSKKRPYQSNNESSIYQSANKT